MTNQSKFPLELRSVRMLNVMTSRKAKIYHEILQLFIRVYYNFKNHINVETIKPI